MMSETAPVTYRDAKLTNIADNSKNAGKRLTFNVDGMWFTGWVDEESPLIQKLHDGILGQRFNVDGHSPRLSVYKPDKGDVRASAAIQVDGLLLAQVQKITTSELPDVADSSPEPVAETSESDPFA